ncbi:hypothetical protein, partial [Undibacterium sp.]|uniref:hypothetical protein n=1 Tax=Undibacterium sp. TaxID=1914977 RepID=UPI0025D6636B
VSNFSHFTTCTIGHPAGTATLRRLFWHTFFGEAKKVCSCRSTTGQQSHNNDRSKKKPKQQNPKHHQASAHIQPARIFHAGYKPTCPQTRMEYACAGMLLKIFGVILTVQSGIQNSPSGVSTWMPDQVRHDD